MKASRFSRERTSEVRSDRWTTTQAKYPRPHRPLSVEHAWPLGGASWRVLVVEQVAPSPSPQIAKTKKVDGSRRAPLFGILLLLLSLAPSG